MSHWRIAVVVLAALVIPGLAGAAPVGQVVIAQGVDPTTLDMMNQQEQPASNVGAQMFESLLERDQSLKLVPALAAEMPKLVAPTTWEFKLRKGVKFHNGEEFTAESVKFSLERLVNPANKLRGSSSFAPIDRVEIVDHLHGEDPHQEAVAGLPQPHRPAPGRDVPAQGVRRQGHGGDLQEPDRHRAVQVRALVQGRRDRDGGLPRLLGRRGQGQDRRVQADSRRRGARGRPAERRDRRGREHPAAPGRDHRQAPQDLPEHGAVDPDDPADDLHAPDGRQSQGHRAVRRPHRRQARAPGAGLRDRRRRDHQERHGRQGRAGRHHAAQPALRLRPEPQAHQAGRGQEQEAAGRRRLPQRRRDHAQRAAGTVRARQGSRRGGGRPAEQGRDQDHAAGPTSS